MGTMKIELLYEYDCGGYSHSKYIEITRSELMDDPLLVLVLSYISYYGDYPGADIDTYLHNKFPEIHTREDMLHIYGGGYNIYDCNVNGLKSFPDLCNGLYDMNAFDGKEYMLNKCRKINREFEGKNRQKNFSIFEDSEEDNEIYQWE